jgi:hypothetical protein
MLTRMLYRVPLLAADRTREAAAGGLLAQAPLLGLDVQLSGDDVHASRVSRVDVRRDRFSCH